MIILRKPYLIDDETGVTEVRLVTLDGSAAAWTDNVDLTDYIGKFVVFTDSAGKKLWGYIKAADTAESLGTNIAPLNCCTDPDADVDVTTGWGAGNNSVLDSIAGGDTGNCLEVKNGVEGFAGRGTMTLTTEAGALYKTGIKQKSVTAYTSVFKLYSGAVTFLQTSLGDNVAWTETTDYFTPNGVATDLSAQNSSSVVDKISTLDDFYVKKVTHLGTDAITIVSTHGGATQNWAGTDGGFNPNDSTMTLQILNLEKKHTILMGRTGMTR